MGRRTRSALGREAIRPLNQRAVFYAIHQHGPISRADLAKKLRLSAAALTNITSDLIASGLVYEAEQGATAGVGRKPIPLRVNYDHAFVFGIKVSDSAITTALTNLKADVLSWRRDAIERHDVDAVLEAIHHAVEALRDEHAISEDKVVGLGVNLPGIIDPRTGSVRASPLLGWTDTPIARLLEERLGIPALAENDVNALAAATAWFGDGKDHADFLVLTLGRGVGMGIVLNGQVYHGPRGGAGEFGHTLLDASGPDSTQSKRGTVEAFLSDSALLERAHETVPRLPADATAADLARLAEEGDAHAVHLFEEAGSNLGKALANLVNIFAPTLIILGGEGMRAAPFLLPAAERSLREYSFCDLAEHTELVVASWGDEAWAQGAAGLVASRFFNETAPFLGGDQEQEPEAATPTNVKTS